MRLTRHNGRAGKHGVYNPKHNDRSFNIENSEHIDANRVRHNIYWDIVNGLRTFNLAPETELSETFEEVEKFYYHHFYGDFVKGQNARNEQSRHTERNRTTEDIRLNRKTCPEESIYQIGTMEEHVDEEELAMVVNEFLNEFQARFGSHIHILDWALHLDEGTPHIHERHVFDCENQYGELCPQQEKALEALGFELPFPDKKRSKHNSRKVTFDAVCREMLFDICKKHGLHLEEEPKYGGEKHKEKQDYIIDKQNKKLDELQKELASAQAAMQEMATQLQSQATMIAENEATIDQQAEQLDELTMKVEDVEALIDEVSELAYDKAVEVVTDAVRAETQKEDLAVVAGVQNKINASNQKLDAKVLSGINQAFARVQSALQKAAQKISQTILSALQKSEVRAAGVEQIKTQARESIMEKLKRNQAEVSKRSSEQKPGQDQKKKQSQLR